ncbi:MAG: transketolase [bacterium]
MDWNSELARKTADSIRVLAADAVQKAKSGHPGLPMGAADYTLVLWASYLNFNPRDPAWPNRDRFVLSAGHGSMLLYALLHLFGFDLSMEDIMNFRQLGSKTPGHPEYGITPGVETTTGPLGQGFGNGVGMALAARLMADKLNTDKYTIIDHQVYALVSDGDLMEGVSSEAASLAGHLGLGNLVYIYDDNQISIEGPTSLAFSEDVARRFEAYHWNVISIDGHDREAADQALQKASEENSRPTLIMAKTRIAYGSPGKAGSEKSHGAPLGEDELTATKESLGHADPAFHLDDGIYRFCRDFVTEKRETYDKWTEMIKEYRREEPERARLLDALVKGEVPQDLKDKALSTIKTEPVATRKASGAVLQVLSCEVPTLYGGSADLAPSNNTLIKGESDVACDSFSGRNLRFGIREHGMGALLNGMALYGLIPYGGTFLIFSDYMRPAIRLAALMGLRVIYVYTHDSIFVGEDGPTHQPVEQLAALRAIPGLDVVRPADAQETALAWCHALNRKQGPSALALTRQSLPPVDRQKYAAADGLERGGYVLAGSDDPDIVIMASGSELHPAIEVYEELSARGVKAKLVNMPCMELFDRQDKEYRDKVVPPECKRKVAIEAAVAMPWYKYTGPHGLVFSVETFGASAPYKVLAEKFGFQKDALVEMIDCVFTDLAG